MNLLVVTIDSLRFDYVSRTNPQIRTPEFDRVAEGLLDFIPTCFSVSSATRPVHTSLFSGLYPFEHGIEGQRDGAIRAGTPRLLQLMAGQSVTGAFSEAPEIFAGLDLGAPVQRLEVGPQRGLGQLFDWLGDCRGQDCCLFAHYWSTHAPYGAADGMAMGETAQLLRRGQLDTVQQRYRAAVIELFENKLAPLLNRLDPFEWAIVILADHGESWTDEELYHGQTLRNAVLHVPLFMHIPGPGVLTPPPVASVVDLFPTLANLFDLPAAYKGFASDLRVAARREPYCLAELRPITPWAGDEVRAAPQLTDARWAPPARRLWALFDDRLKYTFDEHSGSGVLQATFTELPLDDGAGCEHFTAVYRHMRATSQYAKGSLESTAPGTSDLIDERLRALGYLP